MDRMQTLLAVSLNYLDVPIKIENAQEIMDIVYLAERNGININPSTIKFSRKSGHAYSPTIREFNWGHFHSLYVDIREIVNYLKVDKFLRENKGAKGDVLSEWKLDESSRKKLDELKVQIQTSGIERCLIEASKTEEEAA